MSSIFYPFLVSDGWVENLAVDIKAFVQDFRLTPCKNSSSGQQHFIFYTSKVPGVPGEPSLQGVIAPTLLSSGLAGISKLISRLFYPWCRDKPRKVPYRQGMDTTWQRPLEGVKDVLISLINRIN